MWCRWCGGFGMADQMVCSDSDCLTKDMTQGALSDVMGTFTLSGASTTVSELTGDTTVTAIRGSVANRVSVLVAEMQHDAKPEDFFKAVT